MKSAIQRTAWLSSGYGALIVGGLVTAKVLSVLIGPVGYGYLTLYGTLLAVGWAVFTWGLPARLTKRCRSVHRGPGTPKTPLSHALAIRTATLARRTSAVLAHIVAYLFYMWAGTSNRTTRYPGATRHRSKFGIARTTAGM